MARANFRDTYPFDPYGAENAGGLLGMLQAVMRQSQAGAGAGPDPRASGDETPNRSQVADYGPTPPTRITVRPLDPYSVSEETQGGDGDLIGRLLALQAEQGGYQPRPVNSEQSQSAPLDPSFRQLSRMPVEGWLPGASLPIEPSDDQSVQPYPSEDSNIAVQSRMPQNAKTARPDRSLSDRVQAVWDHPHPYGLISMLKTALGGMKIAVQSAYDATSEPSTEEEAFRQNLGREMGPIGTWNAVSSLSMSPGRATKFVLRPLAEAPRIWPQWLPPGGRITAESANGLSAQTSAPGRLTSSALRSPTELQNPARLSNQIAEIPNVRAQSAFPSTWHTSEGLSGVYGATNRLGGRGGILGPPTWPAPMPPIPRPAVPGWLNNTWKIQQLLRDTSFDGSGGGGGGGGDGGDDCEAEIRSAREQCRDAAANNWKGELKLGPFKKKSGGRWTVEDCMKGLLSEHCGGHPTERADPQKRYSPRPKRGRRN